MFLHDDHTANHHPLTFCPQRTRQNVSCTTASEDETGLTAVGIVPSLQHRMVSPTRHGGQRNQREGRCDGPGNHTYMLNWPFVYGRQSYGAPTREARTPWMESTFVRGRDLRASVLVHVYLADVRARSEEFEWTLRRTLLSNETLIFRQAFFSTYRRQLRLKGACPTACME